MTVANDQSERRNPFYILLIIVGFAFVITALAYAVVPVLEEKARSAGSAPPPSPLRDSLRQDGWIWLLVEAGLIAILSIASMGFDRLQRSLKERRSRETIPPSSGGPVGNSGPPTTPPS
jgi:uncharacterized membrane protein